MRGARATFEAATEAAENPQLASALGFLPSSADPRSISTFQHSHALFILHVWLALGRLRSPEIADRELAQILYDRFQDDVERRVRAAGVRVRVGKHLAELERQFYGSAAAYDAALKSGSVVAGLTAALRRNVFLLEAREEAQPRALALYALHQRACLAMTPVEDVVAGNYKFDQGVLLS